MLPRKAYWRALYKRLFARGDLFIAEGPHMARTLEAIGCPAPRVRVVHLGVDTSRIPFHERRPCPDGSVTALIAASFREKKGIPDALEALAIVAGRWPGLRLRIIGDGPLRGDIERRISRLRLGERVDLLGYRDYPDYLAELGKAHILLCPSVTAADGDCEGGAPVCLLDAQASGLPIVATRHCDIPEVTIPDRSAFLSAERDPAALAANLERLLSSPESWGAMGRAGREHVELEFQVSRQAEIMANLYEEVLAARPARL
jgi:colanic acid/amylovoran biosynthesis glycosyltransferase